MPVTYCAHKKRTVVHNTNRVTKKVKSIAYFDMLPNELITEIFSYVLTYDKKGNINAQRKKLIHNFQALRLVSKRFYQIMHDTVLMESFFENLKTSNFITTAYCEHIQADPILASNIFLYTLHWAARTNNLLFAQYCFQVLAHNEYEDYKDSCGDTPLHSAAYYGSRDVIAFLLASRFPVNTSNNYGRTPLHEVIEGGSTSPDEILHKRYDCPREKNIALLITHGAEVNVKDMHGHTPLYHAQLQGYKCSCIPALIKHGARVFTKNNKGSLPPLDTAIPQFIQAKYEKIKNQVSQCTIL